MRYLAKTFGLGVVLAFSSHLAQASPLTGSLTIDGGDNALTPATLSASTTSISQTGTIVALGGTGGLATVPFFDPVTFVPAFTFTVGSPTSGEQLFQFAFNSLTESFLVSTVQTAPNGSLVFYGTLSDGVAADNSQGSYVLTPDASANGSFSGTLDVTATPEPSSLILLGTGLAGAAGLLFRVRRKSMK